MLASYGSHEDSPLEPDGVALVWNSRFLASGKDAPPAGEGMRSRRGKKKEEGKKEEEEKTEEEEKDP